MGLAVKFHEFEQNLSLDGAADKVAGVLIERPVLYKSTVLLCHLFRAAAMVGFMSIPSIPKGYSLTICLGGSVVYRLTIEKNCTYKFALPSFGGAVAFLIAGPQITAIVQGVAFVSLRSGCLTVVSFVPAGLYGTYIVLTTSYDVDKTIAAAAAAKAAEPVKRSCCSK